jgi:hypothetical protein
VALVNDRLGLGFEVTTRKDLFPCQFELQNFQAGQYALGIERHYDTVLRILNGAEAIAWSVARIRAIAAQPDADYPMPSGDHRPIGGRA